MQPSFPAHESTRKRRRWGCTCGCLVFLVGILVGGSLFIYYLVRHLTPMPPEALMDPSVNGFGVLRLNTSDDGIAEVFKLLTARAEAHEEDLTTGSRKAAKLGMSVVRQIAGKLIYPDSYVYISYNPESRRESVLGSVQLANVLGSMMIKSLSNKAVPPAEHVNEWDIYTSKATEASSGTLVSVSPRAIFVSNDYESTRRAIALSEDSAHFGQMSESLRQYYDELNIAKPPIGQDLALALVNDEGRIEAFLRKIEEQTGIAGFTDRLLQMITAQKTSLKEVLGVTLTGDLISADRAKFEITVYCRQPADAKKLGDVFRQALAQVIAHNSKSPITVRGDVKAKNSNITINAELNGLKGWFLKFVPAEEHARTEEKRPEVSPSSPEEKKPPEG